MRISVTESWGSLRITVANTHDTDKQVRVVAFYPGRPDTQFARDLWVPAKSSVNTWMPIGPADEQKAKISRDLNLLLYDRTDGTDRLVLPSEGDRTRLRGALYRPREPSTAVLVDRAGPLDPPIGLSDQTSPAGQAILAATVFRAKRSLSPAVHVNSDTLLPSIAEAYEGVDHVLLASNRLANDPSGARALRRWVEQGGSLWIMLDIVQLESLSSLLGDDLDIQQVDRVGLTTVRLTRVRDNQPILPERQFERPVPFVRVTRGESDTVMHTIDGWPATFYRNLGRGRVIFSTIGVNAMYRPREARDGRSPFAERPDLPASITSLDEISSELRPSVKFGIFSPDVLQPMLSEEIGYSTMGRGTATIVFVGFLLFLIVAAIIGLRMRRDLFSYAAPGLAVAVAILFIASGLISRRAVPPTVAIAEVVEASPGTGDASSSGAFAMFTPESGPVELASNRPTVLDIDEKGLDGQVRRRITSDMDVWQWENMSLPAGVRMGSFRSSSSVGRMLATASFGPNGLEGTINTGPYREISDAVLATNTREMTGLKLEPDGKFRVGLDDVLPSGQFILGSTLTDRQQRRQQVYRQYLSGPLPRHFDGRPMLMAWGTSPDVPFQVPAGTRAVSHSLLVLPVEVQKTPPSTRVQVPSAFIPVQRLLSGKPVQPTMESNSAIEMRLRFNLPPSVLPITVERMKFTLKSKTLGWRVVVGGVNADKANTVKEVDSPVEPVVVEITDPAYLTVDAQGGIQLQLNILVQPGEARPNARWSIDAITAEVVGTTK